MIQVTGAPRAINYHLSVAMVLPIALYRFCKLPFACDHHSSGGHGEAWQGTFLEDLLVARWAARLSPDWSLFLPPHLPTGSS